MSIKRPAKVVDYDHGDAWWLGNHAIEDAAENRICVAHDDALRYSDFHEIAACINLAPNLAEALRDSIDWHECNYLPDGCAMCAEWRAALAEWDAATSQCDPS